MHTIYSAESTNSPCPPVGTQSRVRGWVLFSLAALLSLLLSGCVADYRAQHAPTLPDDFLPDDSLRSSALPQIEAAQLEAVRALLQVEQIVPLPTQPQRLSIPALGVDAHIEAVGRGQDATMALPSHWDTTAWYAPGTRPGQLGNAVIAGHFNTPRDRPAVFWDLAKLVPGDEIHVHDSDGTLHIFAVDRVQSYPFDAAPIAEIFGFTPHARQLNLITCAGEWSRAARNYTERLVVETTLQESIPASAGLVHTLPNAASSYSAEN